MSENFVMHSTYKFIRKLVFVIDRILIDEFKWRDCNFEKFWRRVLEELEIDKERINRIFIEVFGLEYMIADAIYTRFEEYVLKEVTR